MELAWDIVLVTCAVSFVAFTFVVAYGAPFLPTLKPKVSIALDLLGLKKGQVLLELGSGDGRVLKAAAQQGLNAVGYELNPLLVVYSKILNWKYRKQVKVIWGNYWKKSWPPADGIFVFLLQPYMEKLDQKIAKDCKKGVKLVSFAFTVDSRKPTKTKDGLYLYNY